MSLPGSRCLRQPFVNSATRLLGYSATRLLGYSATRLLGYSATRLLGYSATRLLGAGKEGQSWAATNANRHPTPAAAKKLHANWWQARIARQQEIDRSIAAKAEFEYLYDKPYENKKAVRVAGPFTVESLSPHRVLGVNDDDELIDALKENASGLGAKQSFPQMVLENLKTAEVQQTHKENRITFTVLTPWPGELVCAEGRYLEGEADKRAAIFIGPEFGTVQRADLVAAAREAGDAGFDALIACAFNYEAHATEFSKLGRIPVLKARMNADLHIGRRPQEYWKRQPLRHLWRTGYHPPARAGRQVTRKSQRRGRI